MVDSEENFAAKILRKTGTKQVFVCVQLGVNRMALRISWDKQETAILIDAYLRVKNGELSQQNAVKEVSALLRRRAILSGVEIDEIFRNENGISMQMKIVGGLVDEKPSGLHSTTKMFTEMVALYKTSKLQ